MDKIEDIRKAAELETYRANKEKKKKFKKGEAAVDEVTSKMNRKSPPKANMDVKLTPLPKYGRGPAHHLSKMNEDSKNPKTGKTGVVNKILNAREHKFQHENLPEKKIDKYFKKTRKKAPAMKSRGPAHHLGKMNEAYDLSKNTPETLKGRNKDRKQLAQYHRDKHAGNYTKKDLNEQKADYQAKINKMKKERKTEKYIKETEGEYYKRHMTKGK